MLDIVFCTLPYSNLDQLNSAPAILKGVVIQHGFTAKTKEFGCDLLTLCNKNSDLFYQVQKFFITGTESSNQYNAIIEDFYNNVIAWFKANPSKYIGITVFSFYTHKSVLELLTRLKKENIKSKIVLGGRGLLPRVYKPISNDFGVTKLEGMLPFHQFVTKRNLADLCVIGDGEDAILKILASDSTEPLNLQSLTSDQFRYPVPDYSDYNFGDYFFNNNTVTWPITGSKGCVRDCDFCDVKNQFGKYRYRSGKDIANEMISLLQTHGARKFNFTDSLVNGGLKPFKEFLEIVSDHNANNPNNKIEWSGQYICRPFVPAEIYPLIASSGGTGLTIGAESGSNAVLEAMNKKTTAEALLLELENFRQHGITCMLLLMPGHWSETHKNFIEHCQMIVKLIPYVRSGTISGIQAGVPMAILDGSPSSDNAIKNNIVLSEFAPGTVWCCVDNLSNTLKERIYRQLIVMRMLDKLKLLMLGRFRNLHQDFTLLNGHVDSINSFYSQWQDHANLPKAKHIFDRLDDFVHGLLQSTWKQSTLKVKFESNESNGMPYFDIVHNGNTLYSQPVEQGVHELEFNLTHDTINQLTLKMSGKGPFDTVVDNDNNILQDKNIILKEIVLDNVTLFCDYDFLASHVQYKTEHGDIVNFLPGFWQNAEMVFNYQNTFIEFYNARSNKSTMLSGDLQVQEGTSKSNSELELSILELLDKLNR